MIKEFIAKSHTTKNIIKTVKSMQGLNISVLIWGPLGVGKKTLATNIMPNSEIIDGKIKNIDFLLTGQNELIVYNFEYLTKNDILKLKNKKLVAITTDIKKVEEFKYMFGFIFHIPELSQRKEDKNEFLKQYFSTAQQELGVKSSIKLEEIDIDLSLNAKSMKNSIYKAIFEETLSRQSIMKILEKYFYLKLSGNNDYKKYLSIFEVPLIKSGLKKYKYKSRVAKILGINRNTLNKKIDEYKILD